MSRWKFRSMFALVLAAALAATACERTTPTIDEDEPPEARVSKPAEVPTPPPLVNVGDALDTLKKRAEAGDVAAMVALGRAHEPLGTDAHKAEAKRWYEKAAALGDPSAKEALKIMAAQEAATTRAAAEAAAEAARAAEAATRPATRTVVSTAPSTVAAGQIGEVSWTELLRCFDNSDFVTVARPGYRKNPTDAPVFVGLTTAPDKTMTVAASGPDADRLDGVSMVIRVRNRQNLAQNTRVQQAAAITGVATHGNVAQDELVTWISDYLMTGLKSEPVFRNGWQVRVSGTDGEGVADRKKFLGDAVLIELKK